ncbi:MAG: hypothetical protein ONB16_01110 [candidate division KSB1 bacterium]|nr:hypothetical protein [candidate division KSB1 bacterium]MDZ7319679.1 hypothetical protein [candidate division KSB1 bacterium]MDZ7341830.1 hypothetical protein [candidate division KSB1 bacterium]
MKLTVKNDWSVESHSGAFIRTSNDTFYYRENKKIFGTYVGAIEKLYVSVGEKSNLKQGIMIGGLLGGLLGALRATAGSTEHSQKDNPISDPFDDAFQNLAIALGFGVGTLTGAFLGGFIGGTSRSVEWVEVPLSSISAAEMPPPVISGETIQHKMVMTDQVPMAEKYRWSCNVSTGGIASSFLCDDIEKAMIRSGFDAPVIIKEVTPEHYYSETNYPNHNTDPLKIGMPLSVQINYALTPNVFSSLLMLHSTLATVSGHHENPEIFMSLKARSIALCPLVIFRPNSGASELGFGPGLFYNQIEQRPRGQAISRRQKITMGLVGQVALRFPQRTRLFASIGLQYRWLPKFRIGPFKVTSGETIITLDPFTSDFSHAFINAGLGYHF